MCPRNWCSSGSTLAFRPFLGKNGGGHAVKVYDLTIPADVSLGSDFREAFWVRHIHILFSSLLSNSSSIFSSTEGARWNWRSKKGPWGKIQSQLYFPVSRTILLCYEPHIQLDNFTCITYLSVFLIEQISVCTTNSFVMSIISESILFSGGKPPFS